MTKQRLFHICKYIQTMGNRHFHSHYVNNDPSEYQPRSRKAKFIWSHLHKKSTHPDDNTPAALPAQDIGMNRYLAQV